MSTNPTYAFSPDYAVRPGEILEETLQAKGIKKSELAERCQLSAKTISQIVNGKAKIAPDTAIQFERVLGISASVWSNLDASYRLHEARAASQEELEREAEWARRFPLKQLTERGFISAGVKEGQAVGALLDFFGVGSIGAWKSHYERLTVAYRSSPTFKSSLESLSAWLRIGELEAQSVGTDPFDASYLRASLQKIRSLTLEDPKVFEPKMKRLCRQSGVALVFVSELPRTHLSGATRWLSSTKALILQSLRHKSDDHFWFTFFHEAGHILLHGKKDVFIDENSRQENEKETEADEFARNTLIAEDQYSAFAREHTSFSAMSIEAFAQTQGVAPGIVLGRLQHDGVVPFGRHNGLKRKFVLQDK